MATGEVKVLRPVDGVETEAPEDQFAIGSTSLKVFETEAAFVTAKGSAAAAGDAFYDSTANVVKYYDSAWKTLASTAVVVTAPVVSAKSADYTVTDTDGIGTILMTTSSTARTVTLPTAADNTNRVLTIKKVDSGSGSCTVDGEGAETIDGATTVVLYSRYDFITVQSNGTEWVVIAIRRQERRQRKYLSTDKSGAAANGTLTDLTFSNLIVGQLYEVIFFGHGTTVAGDVGIVTITHNGASIGLWRLGTASGSDTVLTCTTVVRFTATATSLTFVGSSFATGSALAGSGGDDETWAELKEINNAIATTVYT